MIHKTSHLVWFHCSPTTLQRLKLMAVALSFCVIFLLLIWSLLKYQPLPILYGPRAIYSLVFLSVLLALIGRILLLRLLKLETSAGAGKLTTLQLQDTSWSLFLLDITTPFYLAATILIDVPASVLTALITQFLLQGYTLLRGYISWMEMVYRLATTSLLAFLAGWLYKWIAGPPHNYFQTSSISILADSREFIASIVACFLMMLLFMIFSFPLILLATRMKLIDTWNEYVRSPTVRFQLLVLSVGPLLPIVNIFDDASAEVAWVFFLVPLVAIYYLALISVRLSIRTNELQLTLKDLSSAKLRQDALRDYASLITRVQEEERSRLARELHDDTAQALIALSRGLEGLGTVISKRGLSEKDIKWFNNLQELADSTLDGVRRACRDLRPSVLDDLGLRAALEWLSDGSASRGVPCQFTCIGEVSSPPPSEAEIAIFRIVQEALSNIWRHSAATQANIELKYTSSSLQVIITDNGQGFIPEQQPLSIPHISQSGLGLLGMRERAALIDANLTISSAPGKGCSVVLTLPLR